VPLPVDLPRVPQAEIAIDGALDDVGWAAGRELGPFTTFAPVPGQAPTGRVSAVVLADDEALYLRFEVADPRPERVRATRGRRDSRFDDDLVGLYLDPGAGGQRAYVFLVNPLGFQMDGIALAGSDDEDMSWDARWRSAGRRTETGYQVELAIPWKSVRHERRVEETGLLLLRVRGQDGEKSSWPAINPAHAGVLFQQARLAGPGALPPSRSLDLAPSLSFGWTDAGPADRPWSWQGVSPGLTAQWSPTPTDTLLGTVNPDFSQVESDALDSTWEKSDAFQIDVNRRYALDFDEKRPFFLEGQEWFDSPLEDLVYTRAMVAPRTGLRATTDRGRWQLAALNVWDASPAPSVSEGGGWTSADLAGREALSTLARVRRELGEDGYVGALYADRAVLDTDLHNQVGGVDARVRLSDGAVLEAAALGSSTVLADGSRIAGPAAALNAELGSERLFLNSRGELLGPGFRAENGFLTHADWMGSWVEGGARLFPDRKLVRKATLLPLDTYLWWTTDGQLRERIWEPDVSAQFGNGAFAFAEVQLIGERFAGEWFDYTRWEGGGGGQLVGWLNLYAFAGGGPGVLYDPEDPRLGQRDWLSLEPTLQPLHWLSLSLSGVGERFVEADGTPVYRGFVARAGLEVYATGQLWARLLLDHSSFDDQTGADALLAWERAPGQALYLGGSSDLQPGVALPERDWQLYAKAAWVFSL
jgi:hypothetical protein